MTLAFYSKGFNVFKIFDPVFKHAKTGADEPDVNYIIGSFNIVGRYQAFVIQKIALINCPSGVDQYKTANPNYIEENKFFVFLLKQCRNENSIICIEKWNKHQLHHVRTSVPVFVIEIMVESKDVNYSVDPVDTMI